MKKFLLLLLVSVGVISCAPTQSTDFRTGDLAFVCGDDNMDQAVNASTGKYTHVAILEQCGDSMYVIDATPRYGVAKRLLSQFISDLSVNHNSMQVMRLTVPLDTTQMMARVRARIGNSYDSTFLPDNKALYCSELVYECYRSADGTPLFAAQPMNFRDSTGSVPTYWVNWFERLGKPVPEGVLGTNPTDLSKSKILRPVND